MFTGKRGIDPDEYVANLPAERREVVSALRKLILKNLPKGYVESTTWGCLTYEIPLSRFPDTYNRQPLGLAALTPQKHYYSLHLMCAYGDAEKNSWLRSEFAKAGKKLDMGKACVRFKTLDDLPLDVIGKFIASVPVEKYIESYEKSRRLSKTKKKS